MSHSMIEGLSQVILTLKPAQRRKLINKLVEEEASSEDEEDRIIVAIRENEPSVPYEKVRQRLKKKGRLEQGVSH